MFFALQIYVFLQKDEGIIVYILQKDEGIKGCFIQKDEGIDAGIWFYFIWTFFVLLHTQEM